MLADIRAVIDHRPTYGYRRVQALVNRQRRVEGGSRANHKAIYRAMRDAGLLLMRHATPRPERTHDGRIAVPRSDQRWCSDGFEIGCDNGERVSVAFSLDCCDREAMSFVATTKGIDGDLVRDLMVASLEHRFGPVARAPSPIEWLSDNGAGYIYIAANTVAFGKELGLVIPRTPVQSPQSNGMAEAFVKTFKRDYWGGPIPLDSQQALRSKRALGAPQAS
ncbi:DDE-type integrase/transposase/recombinase, partial [Thiohalorhabdus methylotrophus]